MRMIKDNVERVVNTEAQKAKLETLGFEEVTVPVKDTDTPKAPEDTEQGAAQDSPQKELEDMTTEELKAAAKKLGLKGISGLNKSELLDVLKGVV